MTSYVLGSELGRGSFGVVFKAEKKRQGRSFQVALKFTDMSKLEVMDSLVGKLDHPNLHRYTRMIQVKKSELWAQRAFQTYLEIRPDSRSEDLLVFESPLATCNLGQAVAENFGLSKKLIFWIMREIAFGLHELHLHGIFHMDVKPENVLLFNWPADAEDVDADAPQIKVRLADFGMSKVALPMDSLSRFGSPKYMAPEVWCSANPPMHASAVFDVWAFGIMWLQLFQYQTDLLTIPYEDSNWKHMFHVFGKPDAAWIRRYCDDDLTLVLEQIRKEFEELRATWDLPFDLRSTDLIPAQMKQILSYNPVQRMTGWYEYLRNAFREVKKSWVYSIHTLSDLAIAHSWNTSVKVQYAIESSRMLAVALLSQQAKAQKDVFSAVRVAAELVKEQLKRNDRKKFSFLMPDYWQLARQVLVGSETWQRNGLETKNQDMPRVDFRDLDRIETLGEKLDVFDLTQNIWQESMAQKPSALPGKTQAKRPRASK